MSAYSGAVLTNGMVHIFGVFVDDQGNINDEAHYAISAKDLLADSNGNDDEEAKCAKVDELNGNMDKRKTELNAVNLENQNLKKLLNDYKQRISKITRERNLAFHECKEAQIKLKQAQEQIEKIERLKGLNEQNYLEWTPNEVVDWISTLDEGRYQMYEQNFRVKFNKQGVSGQALKEIKAIRDLVSNLWIDLKIDNLIITIKIKSKTANEGQVGTQYI